MTATDTLLAQARPIALAVVIGTIGAVIFNALQLPLPWLLGSLTATTAASLLGVTIAMPRRARLVFGAVLGVMLGASFTPELIDILGQWVLGTIACLVATALGGVAAYAVFRKIGRFEKDSAFLAAMPGGINEAAFLADDAGVDPRPVMLAHAIRIFVVIMLVAPAFRIFFGAGGAEAPLFIEQPPLQMKEILILSACGILGFPLAKALRLPAPVFIGAMVLSAAAHLAGYSEASPPNWLIAASQVALGAGHGARFSGLGREGLGRPAVASIIAGLVLTIVCTASAVAASAVFGLDVKVALLAFAPGGVTEMSLIALAIGAAPAIVSAVHIIRIIAVILIAPPLFLRRSQKA